MSAFKRDLLGVAVFLAALVAAPHVLTNDYYVSVLILACLNAVAAVGLNLLLGYAGQLSLGHAAFFGLGAYTTAILTATHGLPIPVGLVGGILLAAATAWLIGIPTLKLTGHYLAMATLGFGIIVYIVFNQTLDLTGGPSGFVGIPRLELFGYSFSSDLSYYHLVAAVLAAVVLISLNIIHSRAGRALMALHTSEKAAQVAGIDIARYKLFVFVLSAGFAALAGVLYAHYLEFIAPSSFGFLYSVQLLVMVVLGGMTSVWGAVAGALFLTGLPEFLRAFEEIEVLLYGVILIVCMMFLPGGIVGGLKKLAGLAWSAKKAEAGSDHGSR